MSSLQAGKALYATFANINVPSFDDFDEYLNDGLERLHVFTFAAKTADSVPTTNDWYTTHAGGQIQGLNTYGVSTTDDWAAFFKQFTEHNVQVGFVFGGAGSFKGGPTLLKYLGTMIANLNASADDFNAFVDTLRYYHVSFIEFDIESSWNGLRAIDDGTFADNFKTFAEKMAASGISVIVGASAPIGTVNGAASGAPTWLDGAFATTNQVFFNVYTYGRYEFANVIENAGAAWLPTDTDVPASHIMVAVTAYDNPSDPVQSGFIGYADFAAAWPTCKLLSTIGSDGYAGVVVWVWWKNYAPYDNSNTLFTSFKVSTALDLV